MEKNEILEKSKKENKHGDERYVQAYNESAKLAMSIGVLACGLINLICVIVSSVSIVLYVILFLSPMGKFIIGMPETAIWQVNWQRRRQWRSSTYPRKTNCLSIFRQI